MNVRITFKVLVLDNQRISSEKEKNYLDSFAFFEKILIILEQDNKISSLIWQEYISERLFNSGKQAKQLLANNNLDTSLSLLKKAEMQLRHLISNKKNYTRLANFINNIMASVYKEMGNLDKAVTCLKKTIDIAEKYMEYDDFSVTCLNCSKILNLMGSYQQASKYAQEAAVKCSSEIEKLKKSGVNNSFFVKETQTKEAFLGFAFYTIGVQEERLKNYQVALHYFKKAQKQMENNPEANSEIKATITLAQQEIQVKLQSNRKIISKAFSKKEEETQMGWATKIQRKTQSRRYDKREVCLKRGEKNNSLLNRSNVSTKPGESKCNKTFLDYNKKGANNKSAVLNDKKLRFSSNVGDVSFLGYCTEYGNSRGLEVKSYKQIGFAMIRKKSSQDKMNSSKKEITTKKKEVASSNPLLNKGFIRNHMKHGSEEEIELLKKLGVLKWMDNDEENHLFKQQQKNVLLNKPSNIMNQNKEKSLWVVNSHIADNNPEICQEIKSEGKNSKSNELGTNTNTNEALCVVTSAPKQFIATRDEKLAEVSAKKIQKSFKKYAKKKQLAQKQNKKTLIARGLYKTKEITNCIFEIKIKGNNMLILSFYDNQKKTKIYHIQIPFYKNLSLNDIQSKWNIILEGKRGNFKEDCEEFKKNFEIEKVEVKLKEIPQKIVNSKVLDPNEIKEAAKKENAALKIQRKFKDFQKKKKNAKSGVLLQTFLKIPKKIQLQGQPNDSQYSYARVIFKRSKTLTNIIVEAADSLSKQHYKSNFSIKQNADITILQKIASLVKILQYNND